MTRFHDCLAETLRWEGSFSDDRHDPGGPTMRGIIQHVYDGYRDGRGLPRQTVRNIADAELEDIYRVNYWGPVRGDELPPGVDLAVWDFGVNSGPPRAVRHLQRALGVAEDGHIGPATLAALRAAAPDDIVTKVMASRRAFLRQIPHFWRFGTGWLRRCDGIEAVALAACRPHPSWQTAAVLAPAPHADPVAQSAEQGRATAEAGKTGITEAAGVTASLATGQVGMDAAAALATTRAADGGVIDLLLALAQRPTFWLAAATVAGSAYVLLMRAWQKRLAL